MARIRLIETAKDQECFSCVVVTRGDVECAKQDVVSLSAIQSESYTWNTGKAHTIHTNYLDRDRIKRCMTKMRVLIVGACAVEQLPEASGTEVAFGVDLLKGHSWTAGCLITVGAGLLSCVYAVYDAHLPTGNVQVTREPELARQPRGMTLDSMRTKIINHAKERTWSLSWCSGDQLWQLIEMLNAQCCRDTLAQLLRRIVIMSETQTMCSGDDRVWFEFFDWVTSGDDYWYWYFYESKLWSLTIGMPG